MTGDEIRPSDTDRVRLQTIPSVLTVYAFSDPHGQLSMLKESLRTAGILDGAGHWAAPPKTALVGLGDYIDRGEDPAGVVGLLRRLAEEATSVGDGSRVVMTLGNHEQMLLCGLRGDRGNWRNWIANGGRATLASFDVPESLTMVEGAAALEAKAPWLRAWLEGLPDAARWRDVLFVHAGLVPDVAIEGWEHVEWRHLWVRNEWDATRGYGLDDCATPPIARRASIVSCLGTPPISKGDSSTVAQPWVSTPRPCSAAGRRSSGSRRAARSPRRRIGDRIVTTEGWQLMTGGLDACELGQRVRHRSHGEGTVLTVKPGGKALGCWSASMSAARSGSSSASGSSSSQATSARRGVLHDPV